MRMRVLLSVVAAGALVVALAGCGRFTVAEGDALPAPHSTSAQEAPSPSASATPPTAQTLDQIEADLSGADGALTQSDTDLSDGDQSAKKDDSH
jgi:hypothetical protein